MFSCIVGRMEDAPQWDRLAAAVRIRRSTRGWSQKKVDDQGGPSNTTLGKIEAGKWRPGRASDDTLEKLDAGLQWEEGSASRTLAGGNPTPLGGSDAEPTTEEQARDLEGIAPLENLQHSVRHTWSTAIRLVDAVLASGPSAALIQAAVAIGSVLSQILADRVIAADVSSEARDALLEEVYEARSQFRRRLLMSLDESEPGGAAAAEARSALESVGDDGGIEDTVYRHQ